MMQNPQNMGDQKGADKNEEPSSPSRYFVSVESARLNSRALPLLIVNRMGYMSQQSLGEGPNADSDIAPFIEQIASVDSKEPDYLLPDTPLKEAIFRIILANGNAPMTADEISEILTEKWAMTAYPRNYSAEVMTRLLESSSYYCIVRIQEPGEEEEDEEDEEDYVEPVAVVSDGPNESEEEPEG